MVRLTVRGQTPEEAVLQVDGWVADEAVELLAREGARLLAESQRLVLELGGVMSLDWAGVALLVGWSGPRLRLRDGAPYLRRLLERHGLSCEEA